MVNRLVRQLRLGLKVPWGLQDFLIPECGILVKDWRFIEDVEDIIFERVYLEKVIFMQLS